MEIISVLNIASLYESCRVVDGNLIAILVIDRNPRRDIDEPPIIFTDNHYPVDTANAADSESVRTRDAVYHFRCVKL